jgi:hypothetical protein
MALNTAPIIASDGTILVNDGAALAYTVAYEEGDFSISGMREGDYSVELFRDRGDIFAARKIQQEPVSVSFSAILTEVHDGTEQTFADVFTKAPLGSWASATSMLAAAGDVWACKVTLTIDSSAAGAGGEAGQTIVLEHFIPESVDISEGTPAKVSVSGMAIPFGGTAAWVLT